MRRLEALRYMVVDNINYKPGDIFDASADIAKQLLSTVPACVRVVAVRESVPAIAIDSLTYRQLQAALKDRGLSAKGTREELEERLHGYIGT